jgi:DNA polymerase IIIc chi subunit
MNLKTRPKAHVLFIEVQDAQSKKESLSFVAAHCFAHKMRLLFNVDNEAAAQYLDKLLWSYPVEAMLPHSMGLQASSEELIFITWYNALNPDQAVVHFNLLTDTVVKPPLALWTLELWDTSNLERAARAEKRWQWYVDQGYHLQRHPWCRDLPSNFLQAKAV